MRDVGGRRPVGWRVAHAVLFVGSILSTGAISAAEPTDVDARVDQLRTKWVAMREQRSSVRAEGFEFVGTVPLESELSRAQLVEFVTVQLPAAVEGKGELDEAALDAVSSPLFKSFRDRKTDPHAAAGRWARFILHMDGTRSRYELTINGSTIETIKANGQEIRYDVVNRQVDVFHGPTHYSHPNRSDLFYVPNPGDKPASGWKVGEPDQMGFVPFHRRYDNGLAVELMVREVDGFVSREAVGNHAGLFMFEHLQALPTTTADGAVSPRIVGSFHFGQRAKDENRNRPSTLHVRVLSRVEWNANIAESMFRMSVPPNTVVVKYAGGVRTREQAEKEGRPPVERTRTGVEDVAELVKRDDFGRIPGGVRPR